MPIIPTGGLVVFGQVPFDPNYLTGMLDYKVEWINTYAPGSARFPLDLRGLSASPQKDPVATWKYLIRADHALEGMNAAADVEAQIGSLVTALTTDYTYSGSYVPFGTILPGTLGDLVVLNIAQTAAYSCFARLDSTEIKLEAGKNVYAYAVPLTFHLLSDWTALS